MTISRADHVAMNNHVLKALGLHDQRGLTGVVLTLSVDKVPTVQLERCLYQPDLAELSSETAWLELQLAAVGTQPVFDAGAECSAALVRISQAIDAHAAAVTRAMSKDLSNLRRQLFRRLDQAEASLAIRRNLLAMLRAAHQSIPENP